MLLRLVHDADLACNNQATYNHTNDHWNRIILGKLDPSNENAFLRKNLFP